VAMVNRDRVIGPASYAPELVTLEDLAPAKFVAIARQNFPAIGENARAAACRATNARNT
jgi:hypothetical protein